MNTISTHTITDGIASLPKYPCVDSCLVSNKEAENKLLDMFTYFDQFYTHLLSFKFEDYGTSYSEFLQRFDDSTNLIEGITKNDISFIKNGNRAYSIQLSLFGNYLFQRLWMRLKYHEEDPICFNTAWNEAEKLCKAELRGYNNKYVNKNFNNFLNLARKILPNLNYREITTIDNPDFVLSLPRYPSITQIKPINESYVQATASPIIGEILRVIENAKPEEIRIYNNASEKYEALGMQKDWLIAGFGLLLELSPTLDKLEQFTSNIYEIEKNGLPPDKFIKGYLEQIQTGLDISDIESWVQQFFVTELEEKRLQQNLKTFEEPNNEESSPEKIGAGRILVNIIFHPISLLIKAAGTLIALILS